MHNKKYLTGLLKNYKEQTVNEGKNVYFHFTNYVCTTHISHEYRISINSRSILLFKNNNIHLL